MEKHSTFLNVIVFLVGVFVPIVGHILDTILILRDDHSWSGKVLWLLVVWCFPFVGALLYMLFGQRYRQRALIRTASPSPQVPSAPLLKKVH